MTRQLKIDLLLSLVMLVSMMIYFVTLPTPHAQAAARNPYKRYLIYSNHNDLAVLRDSATPKAINYYEGICGEYLPVVTYDPHQSSYNGRLIINCVGSDV